MLSGAGITSTSSGGCTTRSNPSCTSYDQINEVTVAGAITLKEACGCTLTITGGTETGHADGEKSHWNGYKLDFRKESGGIDAYVKGTFESIGNRGDGYPQWRAKSGNIYCVSLTHLGLSSSCASPLTCPQDEGNHWDVTFISDGS